MGKKTSLMFPYALCAFLIMLLLGLVFWPGKSKGHASESQVEVESHHKLVRRAGDDKGLFTQYPGGAMYIRWGRLTCPEESTLVYHGAAGGGYNGHAGAPANILCMPREPTWGRHNDVIFPTKGTQSYMYGVEYKTQTDDFPFSHENAEKLLNHNLPCAVCMSKLRGSHLMVPGRRDCLSDWHIEYSGFLMAGDFQQTGASQFICVDQDPEADPAGYRADSSHILIPVEGQCGSLPCPPYISGREMTCSVCTK